MNKIFKFLILNIISVLIVGCEAIQLKPENYAVPIEDCPIYGVPVKFNGPLSEELIIYAAPFSRVQDSCRASQFLKVPAGGCTQKINDDLSVIYVSLSACDVEIIHEYCHWLTANKNHTKEFFIHVRIFQEHPCWFEGDRTDKHH